ncbi:MAG TPA: hypothetical protein VJ201_06735, partial [Candidatus Babeliales bacterium]|nr:hypothetical protein [Candidatus Babeliales bacterium]
MNHFISINADVLSYLTQYLTPSCHLILGKVSKDLSTKYSKNTFDPQIVVEDAISYDRVNLYLEILTF